MHVVMADINDIEFSGELQYDLYPLEGDVQTATGGLRFDGFVRIILSHWKILTVIQCIVCNSDTTFLYLKYLFIVLKFRSSKSNYVAVQ